jgi:glycosyltransferase involved in cell wall biosynthesis
MATGHPVIIAVDTPSNPLEQARAGLTVPPENPDALAAGILKLSHMSLEELASMGRHGRIFVEDHHDMKDLARRFGEALAESRQR